MRDFPIWEDGFCGGCGATAAELAEDDEPLYRYECPACGYEGCDGCFTAGRGTLCAACAESEDAELAG